MEQEIVPRLLGPRDAAAYIGLSEASVRTLVQHGRIRRVTLPGVNGAENRRILIDRNELDRLIEAGSR